MARRRLCDRMRAAHLACVLLLLPFSFPPAHAAGDVGAWSFAGDGWLSVRFSLDGTGLRVYVNATGTGPNHQLGTFLYRADDAFAGGFGFGVFRGQAGAVAQLDASAAGGPTVRVAQTLYSEPTAFMGMGLDVNGAGEATLLLLSAGGGAWSVGAFGGAGNAVLATDAGPEAFLLTQDDFELGQGAHLDALGPGARVDAAREHRLAVEDTLVAVYGPGAVPSTQVPPLAVGANAMTIATPAGERVCTFACDFVEFREGGDPARTGVPGAYAFKVSGAAAGLAEDVTLWGADARLAA